MWILYMEDMNYRFSDGWHPKLSCIGCTEWGTGMYHWK